MADYRVSGVTKSKASCDCITHLCGPDFGKLDVAAVIRFIESRQHRFYTLVGGAKAYLEVVNATPKYVRTEKDGTPKDNLLSLPACPQ